MNFLIYIAIGVILFTSKTAFGLDSETFCKNIADNSGGSYVMLEQCLQEEANAKARLNLEKAHDRSKKIKKLSAKTERKEMAEDEGNLKFWMGDIPETAMRKKACGSPLESELIKIKFVQLSTVYQLIHADFPKFDPPLMDQVNEQQGTYCKLMHCDKGLDKDWCERTVGRYDYADKRLDELLKSAFQRAVKRNYMEKSDLPAEYKDIVGE